MYTSDNGVSNVSGPAAPMVVFVELHRNKSIQGHSSPRQSAHITSYCTAFQMQSPCYIEPSEAESTYSLCK